MENGPRKRGRNADTTISDDWSAKNVSSATTRKRVTSEGKIGKKKIGGPQVGFKGKVRRSRDWHGVGLGTGRKATLLVKTREGSPPIRGTQKGQKHRSVRLGKEG